MGIAALVLGIASIVIGACWANLWWLGAIIGVVGIVLGAVAMKKADRLRGLATAGLICSIIGVALCIIFWLACLACASSIGAALA